MAKISVAPKILRKNRDRAHSAEGERGVHDAAFMLLLLIANDLAKMLMLIMP